MGILRFLAATAAAPGATGKGAGGLTKVLQTIKTVTSTINTVVLALIGVAAIVFAVFVAFRLARAEDEGKRKEAKQQLLWSIIAIIVVAGVFAFSKIFIPEIQKISTDRTTTGGDGSNEIKQVADELISNIKAVVGILFEIFMLVAVLFAVYIGVRLATAQDEGKRKEAKKQILWTLIAAVGAVILGSLIDLAIGILAK